MTTEDALYAALFSSLDTGQPCHRDDTPRDGANDNRSAPPDILHAGGRSLFGYWDRIRGGKRAPHRRDIDLKAFLRMRPWAGVLEAHAEPCGYRWRLAGTGLDRLWGRGLTGKSLTADWPDFERRTVVRALDGVTGRLQPFVACLLAIAEHGEAVGIELLGLPLAADDGSSVQVLCGFFPFSEPDWLGRATLVSVELTSLLPIPAEPRPVEAAAPRSVSVSERLGVIRGGDAD